jgi:hypothetical protein
MGWDYVSPPGHPFMLAHSRGQSLARNRPGHFIAWVDSTRWRRRGRGLWPFGGFHLLDNDFDMDGGTALSLGERLFLRIAALSLRHPLISHCITHDKTASRIGGIAADARVLTLRGLPKKCQQGFVRIPIARVFFPQLERTYRAAGAKADDPIFFAFKKTQLA